MSNRALPAIFDDPAHPLAASLAAWGVASPRYATFLAQHRDKIRKKARGARDPEALDDLALELAVARDLHRERLGEVGYEAHLPGRTRMPDFALTLRNGATVLIEVTRLRPATVAAADEASEAAPHPVADSAVADARLALLVCGKLGQLVPNLPNLLVVGFPVELFALLDVEATMRALLARAERREWTPRERHYIRTPLDFFRPYRHLSGLLVRPWPPVVPALPAAFWTNRQATKPIPTRVRACLIEGADADGAARNI